MKSPVTCRACGEISDEEDFAPTAVPGMGTCPKCDGYVPVNDDFEREEQSMDVNRSVRHAKLANLGAEWAGKVDKEIWDQMGPTPSGLEKGIFYMAACAEMGARLYDTLMKDDKMEGAEIPEGVPLTEELRQSIAQDLLQRTFTIMGALIRGKGHGVQVSTKLMFKKVANSQGVETAEEEKKPCQHQTCSCALDPDGNCAECMEIAQNLFKALLDSIKIAKQSEGFSRKLSCIPCLKRHLDYALAKVVREGLGDVDPAMSESFMRMLFMSSQTVATMEMPLTNRAWDEIQRRGKQE